jgi:hypothetical protein
MSYRALFYAIYLRQCGYHDAAAVERAAQSKNESAGGNFEMIVLYSMLALLLLLSSVASFRQHEFFCACVLSFASGLLAALLVFLFFERYPSIYERQWKDFEQRQRDFEALRERVQERLRNGARISRNRP